MQILVSIIVLVIVLGGLFLVTMSRGEGKELKKSCGCAVPSANGEKPTSCCSS